MTSRWPRSLGSDVTSTGITRKKLQIFLLFLAILHYNLSKKTKNDFAIFSSDVTWEVTSRWPRSLGSDVTSQWLHFHFKWPSLLQVARRWPEPLALAICSSLAKSDVTSFKWRSLQVTSLPWPSARHFKWHHLGKKIFYVKTFEIAQNARKSEKKIFKIFLQVTSLFWPSASHFSSDRHLN